MKILLTGAAGFIGMHTAKRLLERGDEVLGLDNLNDYYDVNLKSKRLAQLSGFKNFRFIKADVTDEGLIKKLFKEEKFNRVVHLAAQAGVRYSLINPQAYISSNVVGFTNILEASRLNGIEHLVYASSSSVYGGNTKLPFAESDNVDHPVSLYAATKKANELMAHTYSHLYQLPTTGLRFFTVYGPWGRPDMALYLFTRAILSGEAIRVYNYGRMSRDFTYVDDIVEGVVRVLDRIATAAESSNSLLGSPSTSHAPYRVFNIGNNKPVALLDFIKCIEQALGKRAVKELMPLQDGDVAATYADTNALNQWVGFVPATEIKQGIEKFVTWYQQYYAAEEAFLNM
jgi:UDP-glucuronate 4-epimerase